MENIIQMALPGFYVASNGAYGIVLGGVYLCCFIDSDTGEYDITVDAVDESGDFAHNLEWESTTDHKEAVQTLRRFVKRYCPKVGAITS